MAPSFVVAARIAQSEIRERTSKPQRPSRLSLRSIQATFGHSGGVPLAARDLAGQIERAGDEDARRRRKLKLAGDRQRALHIVARDRRNADVVGDVG